MVVSVCEKKEGGRGGGTWVLGGRAGGGTERTRCICCQRFYIRGGAYEQEGEPHAVKGTAGEARHGGDEWSEEGQEGNSSKLTCRHAINAPGL